MNNQLESIMLLLQHINGQLSKPVFTKQEINNEIESAREANQVSVEINLLLNELIKTDVKNIEELNNKLILLHLRLCDREWHLERVHNMVKDLISKSRDHI